MKTLAALHGQSRRPGFTLIEMIMVIGTIAFLLVMLAALTGRVQQQSAEKATKAIITQIEIALQDYYDTYGYYPRANSTETGFRVIDPVLLYDHLASPSYGGFLTSVSSMALDKVPNPNIKKADDPKVVPILVDSWKGAIRVVIFGDTQADHWNMNGGQPLIFSTGRDRAGWENGAALSGAASTMRTKIINPTGVDRDNISNFRDIPLYN